MNPSVDERAKDFGLSNLPEGVFYSSMGQVVADPDLTGQAHYMRRAFTEMKLDGILCIDGKPSVYLKDFKRPVTRREVNELHGKFWNQGAGTLLVIQDPTSLFILSAMVAPSNEEGSIDDHAALIEKLHRVANTLDAHRFVQRVASGQYYRTHAPFFNPDNTVDQYLLDNLGVVSDCLCHVNSPAERKRVHALLGRVIFTCYLIDRDIIFLQDYSFIRKQGVATLVQLFEHYPSRKAKDLLYEIFERLRTDFNGSMFDEDLEKERRKVSDADIDILRQFLQGEELDTRQRTLGFWAYDFSIIPVETISAIYEKFLEQEDATDKEAKGAFYTPKHLAEMVVDEAVGTLDTLLDKRCLDPACGSGIFLVILFNRMAEEWQRRNPRAHQKTRAIELLNILEHKLCGVDVNLTACRITCFSLYIAFLDQFDPPTLREFQDKTKKLLPKLLAYEQDHYKNTSTPVVYEGNFFDPNLPIGRDFQIVIGNPPWVGRNQPSDERIEEWLFSEWNPYLVDSPRSRAKRKAVFIPQRQIAHAFLWKSPTHMRVDGLATFLLPSEVILNQTDEFQRAWFACFEVKRIVHLADYRMFLFSSAQRPCFIATYRPHKPSQANYQVEYNVPKVRRQDPRSGLIPVAPEDRKWISLEQLIEETRRSRAAVLWKTRLWGSVRDVRFLEHLLALETLGDIAGEPDAGKRWIKGQGFQPWYQIGFDERPKSYGAPKPIPGRLSDPFVKTVDDNLQMFLLKDDCVTLRDRLKSLHSKGKPASTQVEDLKASLRGFRRSPDKQLFAPPLILINKGFTKFSFVDFHTFYQHSLTGICGPARDEDLLRFCTVYLKSKLAKYFSFHTASSWGTEREEVRLHELMRLPFPLPNSPNSSADAETIVKTVANRMRILQQEIRDMYAIAKRQSSGQINVELRAHTIEESRQQSVYQLQAELEQLVYRYFDLSLEEITLIEDTCSIYEPSATPATPNSSIKTLQTTTPLNRVTYSNLLVQTLNEWSRIDQPKGNRQSFYFCAESSLFAETGMVLVTLKKAADKIAACDVSANGQTVSAIAKIAIASKDRSSVFEYLRGIIFGDAENQRIYILKPDFLGSWTRSAALNDADAAFQAIVLSKRKGK